MNRKRGSLLLLAVMFVAAAPAPGQGIDDFVSGWIAKQHVPAAAIAVVKDGARSRPRAMVLRMWKTAFLPGPIPFSKSDH